MKKLSLSQRTMFSNIGTLLSGTLLARALGMVGLIFLARIVGPERYGHFAGSLVVIKLAAVCFSLGLDHWLLRYGGIEQSRHTLALHATSCLVLKVGLGILWWLLLAFITPWFDQEVFPIAIVLLMAITVWLEELASIVWSVFNSASENKTAAFLLTIYQLLQFLAIAVPAIFGVHTLMPYLVAQLIAAAVGFLFSFNRMRRAFPLFLDWYDVYYTLRSTIPFAISLGLSLIYGRADIAIVAAWLGSAAVGVYAPAISLVMTTFLIPLTIYSVILPLLSRVYTSDRAALPRLVIELTLGNMLLGIVMGGTLAFSAHLLVRLVFGVQYLAVGDILVILSWVVLLHCVTFALAAVLTAVGWQTLRTWVQSVVAAVNVGTNLLVVARWGIVGVANVFVLTEVLLLVGYLGLVLYWFITHPLEDLSVIATY